MNILTHIFLQRQIEGNNLAQENQRLNFDQHLYHQLIIFRLLSRKQQQLLLDITMRNTVVQHNALNLASNAYMNSTTKFVKAISPPASTVMQNQGQSKVKMVGKSNSPERGNKNGQGNAGSGIVSPKSPEKNDVKQMSKMTKKEEQERRHEEQVQAMAMNLSASIFMNSTTKFMKGFALLAPNNNHTSQKANSAKKRAKSVIKESRSQSPSTIVKQRTPEKNALDMTAANYMNSTTKYMKTNDDAPVQVAKGKIEKIVRGQRTSSNAQLDQTVNRNKLRENEGNVERSVSKEDSSNKIIRRKDRSKDLKFVDHKGNEESAVTVKEKVVGKEEYKRSDAVVTKKSPQAKGEMVPNIPSPIKKDQENIRQRPINTPSDSKISRNKVGEVKSADTKKVQQQAQTSRPFARQPQNARPTLISTQKPLQETTEKNTEHCTSILPTPLQANKTPIKNVLAKTATTLPSGELPLNTPMKSQQPTKIQPSKPQQGQTLSKNQLKPIPIIKQQKASVIQNAKPTIASKKILYHASVLQQESVHINNMPEQVVCAVNKPSDISKYTKNESTKLAGKDQSSQITERNYGISKVNSAHNLKNDEKSQETVVMPKRPIVRKQEKAEPVKERRLEIKPATSPIIAEEKKSPRSQYPLKRNGQAQQVEIPAKTQVQQPVVQNRYGPTKKIESTKGSRQEIPVVNKVESAKIITESNDIARSKKPVSATQIPAPQQKIPLSPRAQQPSIKQMVSNESSLAVAIKESIKQEISKPQPTKQQQQKIEQSSSPSIKYQSLLKQAQIVGQVITKHYLSKLSQSLSLIRSKANQSKLHLKEASILSYEIINIHQNLYKSNLRSALEQLKKNAIGSSSNKKNNNSLVNSKEAAANIIFRLLLSKQRFYFSQLKWARLHSSPQISQPTQTKTLQTQSNDNKFYLIGQLIKISQSYNTTRIKPFFSKLLLQSLTQKKKPLQKPSPTPATSRSPPSKPIKQPRDYSQQKKTLTQTKTQHQSQINYIQARIFDKKRYTDIQKSKLIKKQDEFTKKIRSVQAQVIQKRKKNKELRSEIEQISQLQDLDISLPEYEPLVGILTEIYSGVFGSSEDVINVQALREKYELLKEDTNPLLKQWECLALNSRLKNQARKWQGSPAVTQKQATLQSQRSIISSVLRSYIRERYLWQWLKMTAQKL